MTESYVCTNTNAANINIRALPTTESDIMGKVPSGAACLGFAEENGWLFILYVSEEEVTAGWVYGEYFSVSDETAGERGIPVPEEGYPVIYQQLKDRLDYYDMVTQTDDASAPAAAPAPVPDSAGPAAVPGSRTVCPICGGTGTQYISNMNYDINMGWYDAGWYQACSGCG